MKVKIPSQIKIATHRLSIAYRAFLAADSHQWGAVSFRTSAIEIDPEQPPSDKDVTLLHEVIHIIEKAYSFELSDSDIDRLANGMAEFLKENLDIEFDWSDIK